MSREIDEIKDAAGAYHRWALEARKKYIDLRLRQDPEIRGLYIRSADRVARELRRLALKTPSSYLRKRQLEELEAALRAEAERLAGNLEKALENYIDQAVDAGGGYSLAITLDLFKKAGLDAAALRTMFATVNRQAVEACWARTKKGLFLSDRIWEKSEKFRTAMRDLIQESVAIGQDAVKTARMLQQYVKYGAQTLARDYPNMMERMKGRIPGDICYEALRLARTEMTAAFGEGTIAAARVSPSYKGMKWILSKAHPLRDVCCVPGTLVETQFGPKPIEQVLPGEYILTHRRRFQKVTRIYQRTIQNLELVRLQFQGKKDHILELTVTPNHPVLTDRGWIAAGDLQMGCFGVALTLEQHEPFCQPRNDVLCKALQGSAGNGRVEHSQRSDEQLYDAQPPYLFHKYGRYYQGVPDTTGLSKYAYDIYRCFYYHLSRLGCFRLSVIWKALGGLPRNAKTYLDAFCRNLGYFALFWVGILWSNIFVLSKQQTVYRNFDTSEAAKRAALSNIHSSNIFGQVDWLLHKILFHKPHSLLAYDWEQPYIGQRRNGCKNDALQNDLGGHVHSVSEQVVYHTIRRFSYKIKPPTGSLSYINYNMDATETPVKLIAKQFIRASKSEIIYNLAVEGDNSYTANGIAVHNCDDLAEHDEGLGKGVYSPGNEPPYPAHPSCLCVLVSQHEQPEEFVERLKKWRDNPGSESELEKWYNKIYRNQAIKSPFKQILRAKEFEIAGRATEKAILIDEDGSILLELVLFADKVLTHNHPSGGSFSPEDIQVAATWNLKGVRACGRLYRYYMNKPANGWTREFWEKAIKPAMEKHYEDVYKEFLKAIQEGRMTVDQANLEHWHEVWRRVSDELGLDYGRESW